MESREDNLMRGMLLWRASTGLLSMINYRRKSPRITRIAKCCMHQILNLIDALAKTTEHHPMYIYRSPGVLIPVTAWKQGDVSCGGVAVCLW